MMPVKPAIASRRGKYSRGQSAAERTLDARSRLIEATVAAFGNAPFRMTVATICDVAGMGRNTFYQHFSEVEDALRAATQAEGEALASALRAANLGRTPLEQLREVVALWAEWMFARPGRARFCLRVEESEALSVAGRVLMERVDALLPTAIGGGLLGPVARQRTLPAIGGAETIARAASVGLEDPATVASRCSEALIRGLR